MHLFILFRILHNSLELFAIPSCVWILFSLVVTFNCELFEVKIELPNSIYQENKRCFAILFGCTWFCDILILVKVIV